jgi:hypothetical protein
MNDAGKAGHGPAGEHAVHPLGRDRIAAIYGAEERPVDGCVGVGVAALHDGVYDTELGGLGVKELVKGVAEGDQDPALVVGEILRG